MTAFNSPEFPDISVERDEDEVRIYSDNDTIGIDPSSNGFSVTNDWNDRHFSLSVKDESILYELSKDGDLSDDYEHGGKVPPESFFADLYTAVRGLGPGRPIEHMEYDEVGKPEFSRIRDFLVESGIIDIDAKNMEVDESRMDALGTLYSISPKWRAIVNNYVLEPISVEEAREADECIFAVADRKNRLYAIIFFEDGYYSEVPVERLIDVFTSGSGSEVFDVINSSLR